MSWPPLTLHRRSPRGRPQDLSNWEGCECGCRSEAETYVPAYAMARSARAGYVAGVTLGVGLMVLLAGNPYVGLGLLIMGLGLPLVIRAAIRELCQRDVAFRGTRDDD